MLTEKYPGQQRKIGPRTEGHPHLEVEAQGLCRINLSFIVFKVFVNILFDISKPDDIVIVRRIRLRFQYIRILRQPYPGEDLVVRVNFSLNHELVTEISLLVALVEILVIVIFLRIAGIQLRLTELK